MQEPESSPGFNSDSWLLTPTLSRYSRLKVRALYWSAKSAIIASLVQKYAVLIALYPGSFDPITLGHLDIISRGSRLFERVIVLVSNNPNKLPLFSIDQRLAQIRYTVAHLRNVEVDHYDGLTITYSKQHQAQVLLRGLRVLSDFEKELQMAHTNKTLADDIETLFLATSTEYGFLSSSLVKEIARFGGPIGHLVPHHVARDVCQCYAQTQPVSQPNKTVPPQSPTQTMPGNPLSSQRSET